jgi:hypothetical protein
MQFALLLVAELSAFVADVAGHGDYHTGEGSVNHKSTSSFGRSRLVVKVSSVLHLLYFFLAFC